MNMNEYYKTIINECFRNMNVTDITFVEITNSLYNFSFNVSNQYTILFQYNSDTSNYHINVHHSTYDYDLYNGCICIDETFTKICELIKTIISIDENKI